MEELTDLQERCLHFIDRYTKDHGEAPTRKELAEMLGQKSTHGVNQILQALQRKRYLKIEPASKKRNIVVVRRLQRQLGLFGDIDE